jgi:polyisoprenoid-binding protein YceI
MSTTATIGPVSTPTGTYDLDPAHSSVTFSTRHMMVSKVRGRFGTVSGTVIVAEDPTASSVEVAIDAASIDTGVADRDVHLRSPDFLDVEHHPSLTFKSTRIFDVDAPDFRLEGELTVRGGTRSVVLDASFEGTGKDPWGGERIGFSATTEVDREDFGLTWNQVLETGGVLVGKIVKVEIEAEAVHHS